MIHFLYGTEEFLTTFTDRHVEGTKVEEIWRKAGISQQACYRWKKVALGNSGTGKTYIALALGLAACQKGYAADFITTAAGLVHQLMEAKEEQR